VKIEKLHILQEFQHKLHESLQKAYAHMQQLITMTQRVANAQVVQF
jgi:hypothetical protein